jgi:hypothetical protein
MATKTQVSVTWRLCPQGPGASATHHLMPRRSGPAAGDRSGFEQVCVYCEKTEGTLREEGGTLSPAVSLSR